MRLVVDAEITELGLGADSNLASDVRHLEGLLAEVPLVPVMVRVDVFINEMDRSLVSLVNHKGRRD